jgi:dTDP-4-dehydrorhamnose 3,5-epimerase
MASKLLSINDGLIDGLIIQAVPSHRDVRGSLFEIFRQDDLEIGDAKPKPVMAYGSMTLPGKSRGPHEHEAQTDVFVFVGKFRFFSWDNRPDSKTYGNRFVVDVGGSQIRRIIVPPGVVHGYQSISNEPGLVLNAPDKLYAGWNRSRPVDEIRHEDDSKNQFRLDMENYEDPRAPAITD